MESPKGYWSRRSYHRLQDASPSRVGPATSRRGPRRLWRIRLRRPRVRVLRRALAAPVRVLARIRDAYVRMMVRLASSGALGGGVYGGFGEYAGGFARPALKEYDEKVLVEIYKSLVAQGGHVLVSKPDDRRVPTAQIVAATLRPSLLVHPLLKMRRWWAEDGGVSQWKDDDRGWWIN